MATFTILLANFSVVFFWVKSKEKMNLTSLIFPFKRTYRIKNIKGLNEGVRKLVTFVSKRHDESCQVLFGPLVPLQLCFQVKHIFTGLWSCHFSGITVYVYTFSGGILRSSSRTFTSISLCTKFQTKKDLQSHASHFFTLCSHDTGWIFDQLNIRAFRCSVHTESLDFTKI